MNKEKFGQGFDKGWEASRVLEWTPIHELEESADVMRRAGNDESLGYWDGLKSGQEYFASQYQECDCVDENGMHTTYDYRYGC